MKNLFSALISVVIVFSILSCTSNEKTMIHSFERSEDVFDQQFPRTWPFKKIKEPLNREQKIAVEEMTASLSELLKNRNIDYERVHPTFIKIRPSESSFINKTAKRLAKSHISLNYDATYFAKNPFSAGTFDESSKTMLLSHRAFKDEKLLKQILAHELVHVETYRKKTKREFSPFYCQFKGKQFAPHLLSCDEMNAYHSDIQRYLESKMDKKSLVSKIKAAEMHTLPISGLIKSLDMNSAKIQRGQIIVLGQNKKGHYWVEFPVFSAQSTNTKVKKMAQNYLAKVGSVAREFSDYIEKVKIDQKILDQ